MYFWLLLRTIVHQAFVICVEVAVFHLAEQLISRFDHVGIHRLLLLFRLLFDCLRFDLFNVLEKLICIIRFVIKLELFIDRGCRRVLPRSAHTLLIKLCGGLDFKIIIVGFSLFVAFAILFIAKQHFAIGLADLCVYAFSPCLEIDFLSRFLVDGFYRYHGIYLVRLALGDFLKPPAFLLGLRLCSALIQLLRLVHLSGVRLN